MKKILSIITLLSLLIPQMAFATASSVDRVGGTHIEPLIKTDFIQAPYLNASSTTDTSTFNGSILVGDPNSNSLSFDSINGVFRVITGVGGASFRGGSLGVGTSSPSFPSKFSVYGGATIGTCADNQAAITNDGLVVCDAITTITNTSTSTLAGNLVVGDPNNSNNGFSFDSINGKFFMITGASGAQFRGGGVGIGITAPTAYKLSVYGEATIGRCANGITPATDGLNVCGNTGIGTTTGAYPLTVQGDIDFTGNLYQNGVLFSGGSGNSAFTLGNGFIFNATSSDMVGIGSTTPTATLTVQGSSTQGTRPLFIVASSTNARLFTILPNGNVGIGTTSPSVALEIAGSIVLSNANQSIRSSVNGTGARALTVKSADSGAGTAGAFDSGSGNSAGLSGPVTSKSGTGNTTGTYDAGSGVAGTGASGASTFKAGTAVSGTPGLTTIGGSSGAVGGTTEITNGTGSVGTDGNVNINTQRSNPADGSAGSRGNIRMQYLAIDTHVGIGSTTPIALLAVMASTTSRDPMLSISTSTSTPLQANRDGSVGVGWNGVGLVNASSTPVFPTVLSVRAPGLIYDPFLVGSSTDLSSTSTPPYLMVRNTGNVGIATSTPARTLTVVGNQQLTGGFADNTNSFGTAGQILSTTGTLTLWTGTSTLYTKNIATATTAGPTAGIGNTATLTVNCAAGLTLLSGGASIASNANDAVLRDSFPASTTAWTTVYEATLGVGASGTITGYALCQ